MRGFHWLRFLLFGNPPILPGLVLALVVASLLSRPLGRRIGTRSIPAFLLLVSFGVILAITLTPRREVPEFGATGTVSCDLSRIGPASFLVYARFDDPILNVFMFMPLGTILGLLSAERHRRMLVGLAFLLPVAIEGTQAIVVPLGRACEGGDVFDNLAGLVIGLVIGATAGVVWRRVPRVAQGGDVP